MDNINLGVYISPMRKLLTILIILSCSLISRAAEYLDGYVVMANSDTVKCKFKVKGFLNSVSFYRITITTEEGKEQSFRAQDKKILGYGFTEKGKRYDYIYVDLKPKSESGFYQRIINGDKYKLYVHMTSTSTYPGISTAMPQYVLFNPAGQFEKFETCVLCPWKKQLRELLKEDAKALEALETTSRLEIESFVLKINN